MTLVLPTLPEFEALPLDAREALFIAWVKEQPPELAYRYYDFNVCPLGQFARLITGEDDAIGGAHGFGTGKANGHRRIVTLQEHGKTASRLSTSTTFGDLAASL